MAFLRFRRSSSDEVFSKVESLVSDLSGKVDSVFDELNARIAGLQTQIDILTKRVNSIEGAWVKQVVNVVRLKCSSEIRELRELKQLLTSSSRYVNKTEIEKRIHELEAAIKKEILRTIVNEIMEKLLQG